MINKDNYKTFNELCEIFKTSPYLMKKWLKNNSIKPVNIPNSRIYDLGEIHEIINNKENNNDK